MQFKRLNGVVLHYTDSASEARPAQKHPAMTLVFANSLGTDFRIWDEVRAQLGPDYRFICYDKRGHGLSEAPPAPYRMDDHIGDLEALLDHLGVRRAVVIGLSVGGLIAQGLTARRPDLVAALILCDTAHKIGSAQLWNGRIAAVEANGIASISEPVLERWFTSDFRQQHPEELAGWRAMLIRTPLDGYAGTSAAIRDADFTEAASRIAVPTLCVVGSQDGATPPELVATMASLIPGARLEIIEGSGHLPCIDAPATLARLIADFLAGAGSAQAGQ